MHFPSTANRHDSWTVWRRDDDDHVKGPRWWRQRMGAGSAIIILCEFIRQLWRLLVSENTPHAPDRYRSLADTERRLLLLLLRRAPPDHARRTVSSICLPAWHCMHNLISTQMRLWNDVITMLTWNLVFAKHIIIQRFRKYGTTRKVSWNLSGCFNW